VSIILVATKISKSSSNAPFFHHCEGLAVCDRAKNSSRFPVADAITGRQLSASQISEVLMTIGLRHLRPFSRAVA